MNFKEKVFRPVPPASMEDIKKRKGQRDKISLAFHEIALEVVIPTSFSTEEYKVSIYEGDSLFIELEDPLLAISLQKLKAGENFVENLAAEVYKHLHNELDLLNKILKIKSAYLN